MGLQANYNLFTTSYEEMQEMEAKKKRLAKKQPIIPGAKVEEEEEIQITKEEFNLQKGTLNIFFKELDKDGSDEID